MLDRFASEQMIGLTSECVIGMPRNIHGYRERPRDDSWECNFVLGDGQGGEIDVHSYTLDDDGNHVSGVAYSRKHFTGGFIDGYPVRCISPEWLVKFHSGYELDENDYRDVKAL